MPMELHDRREEKCKLRVENLSVFYGAVQAIKSLSLRVYPNEILGITGPSSGG